MGENRQNGNNDEAKQTRNKDEAVYTGDSMNNASLIQQSHHPPMQESHLPRMLRQERRQTWKHINKKH